MERVIKSKTKAHLEGGEVNDGDKVWVTVKRTINLGNYESMTIDAGYSQTIYPDEHPLDMIEEMEKELREIITARAEEIKGGSTPRRRRKS